MRLPQSVVQEGELENGEVKSFSWNVPLRAWAGEGGSRLEKEESKGRRECESVSSALRCEGGESRAPKLLRRVMVGGEG